MSLKITGVVATVLGLTGTAQAEDLWLECSSPSYVTPYIYLIQNNTILSYEDGEIEDMCFNDDEWKRNCVITDSLIKVTWRSSNVGQDITINRVTGTWNKVITIGLSYDGTCEKIESPLPEAKF